MVFSWGGWFGFGMGFHPLNFFITAVNYFLSRIYFMCISRVKCLLYLHPCGYCSHRGLRKLEALQDFAWLLTRVWVRESLSASRVCGMDQWGLPQTLPEGVITLYKIFSMFLWQISHPWGACAGRQQLQTCHFLPQQDKTLSPTSPRQQEWCWTPHSSELDEMKDQTSGIAWDSQSPQECRVESQQVPILAKETMSSS